jgi:flavin-dependent dehydrogenase
VATGAEVLIVGAGPAGIATAIAASQKGLRVTVADARRPPIDKACGEGLLPEGVSSLRRLGIWLDSSNAYPIAGMCFSDEASSACGRITRGAAFGLRRSVLHDLLVRRACELGVSFRWGTRVSEINSDSARLDGLRFPFHWLVGADGQKSIVRKWSGLGPRRARSTRFGFCCHFAVAPWSEFVEVYWGERCQIYVTPTGPDEICLAVLSSDPQMRVGRALQQFPVVATRMGSARRITDEIGSATVLDHPRSVARRNIALVGDASFTVDGITGQGLSLAFQQALCLGEALASENLGAYQLAHRQFIKEPARMARLLLLLDRQAWLRRKALRMFSANPKMFARMISRHANCPKPAPIRASEMFDLGWQVLRA